jgi:hypothetical protein
MMNSRRAVRPVTRPVEECASLKVLFDCTRKSPGLPGAEGATAPETLRHKDRVREATLERGWFATPPKV